jgi:hypothetical protein
VTRPDPILPSTNHAFHNVNQLRSQHCHQPETKEEQGEKEEEEEDNTVDYLFH